MDGALAFGSGKRSFDPSEVETPPSKVTRTTECCESSQWDYQFYRQRTNDEVHSSIALNPVITKFLDTPQMQRLRHLKQLGTADAVFMNCNHTRLEHSLGVAELARTVASLVAQSQPSLLTRPVDILCVELAGLMHDIGHGPFSHHYERFVEQQREREANDPELRRLYEEFPPIPENWHHEDASLMMVDAALEYLGFEIDLNELDEPLQKKRFGVEDLRAQDGTVLTNRDLLFVKECILGHPVPALEPKLGRGYHGRPCEHQEWLYGIVANRWHGLDVDKIDYFARDTRRALKESGEIDKVMIEEAVVAWACCPDPVKCDRCTEERPRNHLMICYPKKRVAACVDFFRKRFSLHSQIYQHKTNNAVSFLICDLLSEADPHYRIAVRSLVRDAPAGRKVDYEYLPISRAMNHPGAYVKLEDSIIKLIAADMRPALAGAHVLNERINRRQFYKFAGTEIVDAGPNGSERDQEIWELKEDDIVDGMLKVQDNNPPQHDDRSGAIVTLEADDIRVHKCKIHYGQEDRDPLTKMRFVEKHHLSKLAVRDYKQLPEAFQLAAQNYKSQLPESLMERSIRVYSTTEEKLGLVKHAFEAWWLKSQEDPMTTGIEASSDLNFLTQEEEESDSETFHGFRDSISPIQQN